MSIIATIIGIILGVICFSMWTKYMSKTVKRKSLKIDENNFVMKKPQSKVVFHTGILIFTVAAFALYKQGLIFQDSLMWDILFIVVILMNLFNVQKAINRKITVENNKITDTKGNVYSFSEFTSCRVINMATILFIDNNPVLKIENDDIGYDIFLQKLKEYNIKIIDLRKKSR